MPTQTASTSHQPAPHQPGASQTPDKATNDSVHELTCHIQRSVRYHKARERFFSNWSNGFSFISLLAGTSIVASLLASAPDWVALSSGALVATMQALELVFRVSHMAREHSSLASEFMSIERSLKRRAQMSLADVQDLNGEVLTIEAREPPVKRYLDLICHNQVARSIGSNDLVKLKFWQRWFAQYLNGDTALQ